MTFPVNLPPNLPELRIPIENDDYVPFEYIRLDEVDTTDIEVAIWGDGDARPITVWTAHPGPKTPTTEGRYLVFVRATGSPKPAECLGYLIMY